MQLTILAFGITRDILGDSELKLELPDGANVEDLKAELVRRFPEFSKLKALALAVNSEYAEKGQALYERDEVALIPPVSGG
ncbi:MAG: MoaD/ThiS family protein [Saprospirales bacterium]|nr:MoaD/ThiS family protein [Saprospirales bacterium]